MKPYGRRAICCLALLAWAAAWSMPAGAARADDASPLTMAEAVALALKHNPQAQAAQYQVDAIIAQVSQARSGLLPQIEVSETFNRTTSPLWAFGTRLNQGEITEADFAPGRLNSPDPINNFKTALTLTWSLFDRQTWIGWQQARRSEEAGTLALKRSRQNVIAQTAIVYMSSLLAEENLRVVEQALDTARAHLKVVEDRERGGMAVRSDLLRAQVRIADLEQQRFQAQSRVQIALATLGAAMGRPQRVHSIAQLERLSDRPGQPIREQLDEWTRRALAERPDLVQLTIQKEIANQEMSRARAGHYPTLALQGEYEINTETFSDTQDGYTVGAVLRLNLFSGQRISAQVAEARATLARIRSMRDGLALGVRVETQRAFYEAQSAWQSIQVAQTAVEQATEGLRIVTNRYENGLLALISLLDAQVSLQQAQTQHYKAVHDYQVARIALALAGGVIDEGLGQ